MCDLCEIDYLVKGEWCRVKRGKEGEGYRSRGYRGRGVYRMGREREIGYYI